MGHTPSSPAAAIASHCCCPSACCWWRAATAAWRSARRCCHCRWVSSQACRCRWAALCTCSQAASAMVWVACRLSISANRAWSSAISCPSCAHNRCFSAWRAACAFCSFPTANSVCSAPKSTNSRSRSARRCTNCP
ncbi:MAG: hypothetical protein HC918_08705 [Oscillatoriales cyanobacterium SM2_1_8]|nr:hypothetical protein [Oscillatoriales cyanobacterium SM2_1_8]